MGDGRLARLYLRFRTGKTFVVGLILFCAVWWAWNTIPGLPHFDNRDLALLMVILSIEASVSGAAIFAQNEQFAQLQREQDAREERLLRYMADLLEAQSAAMKALRDDGMARAAAAAPGPDVGAPAGPSSAEEG